MVISTGFTVNVFEPQNKQASVTVVYLQLPMPLSLLLVQTVLLFATKKMSICLLSPLL